MVENRNIFLDYRLLDQSTLKTVPLKRRYIPTELLDVTSSVTIFTVLAVGTLKPNQKNFYLPRFFRKLKTCGSLETNGLL